MTSHGEDDLLMRKIVYSELTELLKEVKTPIKKSIQRELKYGNTLTPSQIPQNSKRHLLPQTQIQSQNMIDATNNSTTNINHTINLPALSPQRASYKTVNKIENIHQTSNSQEMQITHETLDKLVEKHVSKQIAKHLAVITENTYKLYLDSRKGFDSMMNQLQTSLLEASIAKLDCEQQSNQLKTLITKIKSENTEILETKSMTVRTVRQGSKEVDTDTKPKRARTTSRARKRSVTAKSAKSTNILNNVGISRPKLTQVSMLSSFQSRHIQHKSNNLKSIAIAGFDTIIFEIKSNVSIRRPMIKLWPKLSTKEANRMNPDIMHISDDSKSWKILCRLNKKSPLGPVSFVINYQSLDNVVGNTVSQTTDKSNCTVITSEQVLTATAATSQRSTVKQRKGVGTRTGQNKKIRVKIERSGIRHRSMKKNHKKRSKTSKSFNGGKIWSATETWELNLDNKANTVDL